MENSSRIKNIIRELALTAGYLWSKGWAERNAGNISVNITDMLHEEAPGFQPAASAFVLNKPYPGLAGESFLITAAGTRMRDLANDPLNNVVLITIGENGTHYTLKSGIQTECRDLLPTSELPTHLEIHQMIVRRHSGEKVVIHTHADELIALTQLPQYKDSAAINHTLWGMHPETMLILPKGTGFVPYCLPGSETLAEETVRTLQKHDMAIWEKHGVIAIGKDVEDTFDNIDIACKSARIWFACKSVGNEPEGLSAEQISELRDYSRKLSKQNN